MYSSKDASHVFPICHFCWLELAMVKLKIRKQNNLKNWGLFTLLLFFWQYGPSRGVNEEYLCPYLLGILGRTL